MIKNRDSILFVYTSLLKSLKRPTKLFKIGIHIYYNIFSYSYALLLFYSISFYINLFILLITFFIKKVL